MLIYCLFFFFNDTATTEIYTLSLHDALPISTIAVSTGSRTGRRCGGVGGVGLRWIACRVICITRATAAAAKPRATSSRDRATRSLGGSAQGAVVAFRPLRFPGPPSEPDVRVAAHPALRGHAGIHAAVSLVCHGVAIRSPR